MKRFMDATQRLGRALMLPIAVLPVAALLLRLGQPDLLDLAPLAAAGEAIFSNLGILFAIGIGVGLARENHGAAGLAGAVAYLVATKGTEVFIAVPAEILAGLPDAHSALAAAAYKAKQLKKASVPIGILSGLAAGWLYNRYSDIKLPDYLAFFAGRRFVPIISGLAGLGLAFAFGLGWPFVERGMDSMSHTIIESGSAGLFIYGVLNRLLIVTGLHHILNNVAWFLLGDYNGATGDLNRFFAGDPTAGAFMSGFFPVMMFGLPAACLAMYHTALPERRRAVGGLLLSMALTSFLTGVTEPIEFTFMFLAPMLYAVHAALTGAAMVTMDLLQSHLGFGFSAGLFDFALNYSRATHPLYLVPVGALYFALYYGLFRYFIVRYNLHTPGREPDEERGAAIAPASGGTAGAYVAALGGAANLREVAACTTRLRLELADRGRVDRPALKRLGARGTVDVGANGLQVVVGPIADGIAGDIRAHLATAPREGADAHALLAALGGSRNVEAMQAGGGRLLFTLRDANAVDRARLESIATRGIAFATPSRIHVLDAEPESLEASIAPMLR
jgi:N-acetylglucosamine PTS system EIICBA or EIICB component